MIVDRLEAATSRLEDIASSTNELPQVVPALTQTIASPPHASGAGSPAPLPPAASASALPAPVPAKTSPLEPLPESIEDFDAFLSESVEKYVKASGKLGGLIAEQASKVLEGFTQQRKFLLLSTRAKRPEIGLYQELIKPINDALMSVNGIKDANRGSPVFSQLSAVAEGIMVLAWVTVDNRPYKHVEESLASAQFFGNRVMKEHKDKNPEQIDWIQSFYQIFHDLTEYAKRHFPGGIPWNPKGLPAAEALKTINQDGSGSASGSAPPPPPPAGGLPPPPPPPGPPPVLQIKQEAPPEATSTSGFGAVFDELNQGENVTRGLRKVDRSEMTHKNPALRAGSTVSDGSSRGKSPAPGKKPKPESMRVKKPPKKELEGNKWTIVSCSA